MPLSYEEKESKIDWISSEYQVVPLDGRVLLLKSPSVIQKQYASFLFKANMEDCANNNVMTKDDMRSFMLRRGFWTEKDIKTKEDLVKNLDNFKIELFNNYHRQGAVPRIKEYIKITRDKLNELFYKEVKFDSFTAEYISSSSKICFLVGSNIFDCDRRVVPAGRALDAEYLVDPVIAYIGGLRPTETDLREIARSDPWRGIWSASEKVPLTGGSSLNAVDMSVEFRSLVTWSKFYDNVYQSSECPRECIIEDDDALDGWCLLNRKKREGEDTKKLLDKAVTNSKIKNSQEVLVVANSWEEVKQIDEFNDTTGRIIKQQRMNALKKAGELNELEMPDTKQRLEMAMVNVGRNAVHGGRR